MALPLPTCRSCLLAVVLFGAQAGFSQSTAPSDPAAPAGNESSFLRIIPRAEPEPWSKITQKQRFGQFVDTTFSPSAAVGALAGGAIGQAMNSPEEWGQGMHGYGIRVASSYGSTLVGNTITYGTSVLLHEDNRYFRSTSQGFFGRMAHVIISPYVARNDEGHKRFSGSLFLGRAGYAGIQLAWSPPSWQGWNNVGLNYLAWYGQLAGTNLVKEFYPSVSRMFHGKHPTPAPGTPAAPNK